MPDPSCVSPPAAIRAGSSRKRRAWHAGWMVAVAAALGFSPAARALIPAEWKNTPYAYEAHDTPIAGVLKDFTDSFGVQLVIDGELSGTVEGRLRAEAPKAFLDRLALEHRFQWFVYNNTLYVSPLEAQATQRLEVSADAVPDMKKALTDIGLLDPRFGWGELADEGVVLVSGPARYVSFVTEFARERETPDERQEIISYPLKYATAADRTIDYRGAALTIPGIASILRGLLQAPGDNPIAAVLGTPQQRDQAMQAMQSSAMGVVEQLAQQGLGSPNAHRLPAGGEGGHGKIRVEADVRNNAVLIYDAPKRRELYAPLMKQLDIPRKLVEIDAIIVDIDRTQLAELASNWNVQGGDRSGGASLMQPGVTSTLFIQDYGDFFAELRALEGRGLASVVANPSILTLENQPAVIDFNRTEYIQSVGERVATVQPITAGTSLQVIPHTIQAQGMDQIQLVVDIEDGHIEQSTAGQATPSVRRGTVATQAVMGEKTSLVVGGFHVEETADNVSRVPLLGRLPVVGKLLFSTTSRETSRRERLFILTPRLIGDQVDPARYLPATDRHEVEDVMTRIDGRRNGRRSIGRNEVSEALAQLAGGDIPRGFVQAGEVPYVPSTLCTLPPGLVLDTARAQWFKGKDFGIAVGVVRNVGQRRVRLDEAGCGNRWTLAVAAFPQAWLAPAAELEVFIAMRPPEVLPATPRPSLLAQPGSLTP